MLRMRARSFALRDCFPDVLKGLIAIEEARDLPPAGSPSGRRPHDRCRARAAGPSHGPPVAEAPSPNTPDERRTRRSTSETPPDDTIRSPGQTSETPRVYPLETKQGITTFRTGEEWLACWAKLVRACKAANALDKLQTARDTNAAHIAAIAAFDPEPVATLNAELARALAHAITTSLMTRPRRRSTRHRPPHTSPATLSGATTLDEAAAILADLEGRQALRHVQAAAARNLRHARRFVEDHMQRNQPDLRMPDPAPLLGIFWAITDPLGQPQLLTYPCTLAEAEPYGDCLTCPAGHYEIWQAWRRGQPKPPLPVLAPIIAQDEYERWPRGRIVYEQPPDRFVVYADRQLLAPTWLAHIRMHFDLPAERTTARSDLHYRSARTIGPP